MSRLILALIIFGAFPVLAEPCPNLTGKFNSKHPFQYIQKKGDCSQIQYVDSSGGSDTILIDNQWHGKDILTRAHFEGELLFIENKSNTDKPLGMTPDGKQSYGVIVIDFLDDNGQALNRKFLFYDKDGNDIGVSAAKVDRIK